MEFIKMEGRVVERRRGGEEWYVFLRVIGGAERDLF
jgi:hypothetical protein